MHIFKLKFFESNNKEKYTLKAEEKTITNNIITKADFNSMTK